ncbi:Alkaline phosphatase synthesis transcriptional regulatory protein PhoP [Anaerolineae bacterium]|nr:Alkaline phosphatase synthesis transcriptional regulatory protein PhoP [Anaerolineae bacterium]
MAGKKKKILLIENDMQLIELARYPLEEDGNTVIASTDGPAGLRAARREQPDLVMVDYRLPTQKGNDVAKTLRKDPATEHIRIIMIADESQLENLEIGPGSSVDDFLIKPFSPAELITKIKPLLKSDDDLKSKMISTGNADLDGKMGGGVPFGSLTLIEGDSGAGKSVLSQQMMYGCLVDKYKLSLFTSENSVKSLVKQMRSLNMDIMDYLLLDRLRIFPIETSRLGKEAPPTLLKAMKQEKGREMIFIDSLTSSIPASSDREVMGFFEDSKRLCGDGTTVITIIHSHGLTRELLTRIRSLCDAHLQLRTEEVGNKLVKTLEVTKVRGAEQTTGNIISFEVEPGWGIRVIPINKAKG